MRFGGIVLVVLLTLGACSSDPEPKEPKRTATSTAPTATPPTMPAQAKQDTPEGAAAFVKHYIDVFNYASNTGDVDELSRLSAPSCEGCQSYIKLYRDTYKAGGYFRDSDWKLSNVEIEQDGNQVTVYVHVDAPAGTYRSSRKSKLNSGTGEDAELIFTMPRSERWMIRSFDRRTS